MMCLLLVWAGNKLSDCNGGLLEAVQIDRVYGDLNKLQVKRKCAGLMVEYNSCICCVENNECTVMEG
jgi:hypothetical protein